MNKNQILWLISVIWINGCATSLTNEGQRIQVMKSEPTNCKELGEIYGSGSGGGYTSSEMKLTSAKNELRNKVANLGGNILVLDTNNQEWGTITLSGRGFKCPKKN